MWYRVIRDGLADGVAYHAGDVLDLGDPQVAVQIERALGGLENLGAVRPPDLAPKVLPAARVEVPQPAAVPIIVEAAEKKSPPKVVTKVINPAPENKTASHPLLPSEPKAAEEKPPAPVWNYKPQAKRG